VCGAISSRNGQQSAYVGGCARRGAGLDVFDLVLVLALALALALAFVLARARVLEDACDGRLRTAARRLLRLRLNVRAPVAAPCAVAWPTSFPARPTSFAASAIALPALLMSSLVCAADARDETASMPTTNVPARNHTVWRVIPSRPPR
jgi:hypothetical protein